MRQLILAPARRAFAWRALAAAALTIGYADLARGGITISAVLLIVGHMVLVPMVIRTW